jgi:hypothetical protein
VSLASLAAYKRRLGVTSSDEDTLLGELLDAASRAVERYCRRTIEYAAADITELFDGGDWDLQLQAWPVTAMTSVKIAWNYDFGGVVAEVADVGFRLNAPRGRITRLPDGARWPCGPQIIQAVYRGGYLGPDAAPVAGVSVSPGHMQEATLLHAVAIRQRQRDPGAAGINLTGIGGGISFGRDLELVEAAKGLLVGERRAG